MKKLLLSIFLAFGMNFGCFAANNATDIYLLAQSGNTADLKAVENIDVVDSDGNTALCSAIKYDDVDAYNILKKAGANTEHKCTKKIPSEQYKTFIQKVGATNKSWSFLGLGKWAWTAIGAGVVAGGAAAAMGGGGGGSGGSSGSSNGNNICQNQGFTSHEPCVEEDGWTQDRFCEDSSGQWYTCKPAYCFGYQTSCGNGYEEVPGDTCKSGNEIKVKCQPSCDEYPFTDAGQCPEGYTIGSSCLHGNVMQYKCDIPATCPYETTSCSTGFHENGNTCLSGETTYVECEANTCEGYDYTEAGQCPEGYTIGSSCLAGTTMKYMCDVPATCPYETQTCSDGYVETGNTCKSGTATYVECVPASCPYETTSCSTGFHESGNTCLSGETTYVECEANTCEGYDYTEAGQCPEGYTIGSSCLAGTTTKYMCDENFHCPYSTTECTGGYEETGNSCLSGTTTYIECRRIACGPHTIWSASGCSCATGYENYVPGEGCSAIPIDCGMGAHQEETYCVCDTGYSHYVPGVGCYNIIGIEHPFHETSEINIENDNDDNIWIRLNSIGNNTTEVLDDTELSTPKVLNITNNGDGEVSGIHQAISYTYGRGVNNLGTTRNSTGTSNINNTGDGNVFGLKYPYTIVNPDKKLYVSKVETNITDGVSGTTLSSNGTINIENHGAGNVYGMYGDKLVNAGITGTLASTHGANITSTGTINIENHGDGNVYGMYSTDTSTASTYCEMYNAYSGLTSSTSTPVANGYINIDNYGNGNVYGMYADKSLIVVTGTSGERKDLRSYIDIENNGTGSTFGVYSSNVVYSSYYTSYPEEDNIYSYIHILNNGAGDAYGIYAGIDAISRKNIIHMENTGSGTVYGIFAQSWVDEEILSYSAVSVVNTGNGTGYGKYGNHVRSRHSLSLSNESDGNIIGLAGNIVSSYNTQNDINITLQGGTGLAIGVYGNSTSVGGISNITDTIEIYSSGGTAVGIYAQNTLTSSATINIGNASTALGLYIGENGTLTNSGDITINNATTAYGIYAAANSNVTNSGNITITNSTDAYGIYAENGATVTNTGTININGVSCDGSSCNGNSSYGNHIVLNGATLVNAGTIIADILDLDAINGNMVAQRNSQFLVNNAMSGTLNISSELVQSGNQTTYIAENMIDAGDVSGLNVRSASAMFDASLSDNGHDVVMQMKDFDSLTDNKSLAAFLANNYANGNGMDLFAILKSMENMSAFNGTLSGLTGLNTFTQFAHEDLSAMREISFSMNNKLFENSGRDSFDISDSMGHFSFSSSHNSGSGQYGISSDKISDNWKLGYGMAMANINTSNGDGFSRQNKMWLFYMPATYTNDGYELVIAPKAGFANSEYSRRGYNNVNYEGYIEKRIFGLMNDLRYPLSFGNWTFAPDVAFNAIVYTQSGHEEEREFGLVIPYDRTVSVETGLGLYTKYEKTFESGSRLKLNTGLMAYREFGDSYNLKLGIQGMDGTFNLYNNDYKYRGAASMGVDYLMGRFHLYGNAQYFMDNDNYMNFKGGVSYRF